LVGDGLRFDGCLFAWEQEQDRVCDVHDREFELVSVRLDNGEHRDDDREFGFLFDAFAWIPFMASGRAEPERSDPYNRDEVMGEGTSKIIRSREFKGTRAWDALPVAAMNGITTRLHWTNEPYEWHVNDGAEVFAVLDGKVEMRYRVDGDERSVELEAGDVFYAGVGCEHVAHPIGEARILVVEKEGSV
jgi:mannose-6-phosphate isomerase-like protein (cupin superfamily)